jgi:hypothetical protein
MYWETKRMHRNLTASVTPSMKRHEYASATPRDPWVRVKNGVATEIPPFSVVLITAVTRVGGRFVYTVRQPNAAATDFNWNGYLVTGETKIGNTVNAEGWARDLTEPGEIAYNNAATPAIGEVWGPKHGQFTLEKNYYGFEILGGNTTFDTVNVTIARWVGVHSVLGKTDGASTKGSGTVTVSVYAGAVNSDADTTMNITGVGNEFADVETTKYVWVTRNGGVPYLTSAEC